MSLITRCPACGTMFKVVPDQLKISEGWVRCGHCADVFDAAAHLQADPPPSAAEPIHTAPDSLAAETEAPPPVRPAHADPDPGPASEVEGFASSLNTEVDEAPSIYALDSAQFEAEAQALRETPLDQPFELRRQDDAPEPSRPARFEPISQLEPEPDLHDLSFVRQARRRAFWRSPGMRAVMVLLLLLLAGLLALQVGVHDRDRLAATEPALRPWLARACEVLNCRIGPPRQIDAIAIDSSNFNKLRGDAYRLNFTLKNQAGMAVAMPALELTLTDAQDQPIVRRVLLPGELGAHPGVLAPAADWSGSLALTVAANGASARVAGYRLLAFYP
jgi:predicted Zn finger-like uncharacterized protein